VFYTEGTGQLVFEFGRILEYLQSTSRAQGHHLFWMFENVASMRADIKDTISECFKVLAFHYFSSYSFN
jgi:site-specific DNA-cytosine methylase